MKTNSDDVGKKKTLGFHKQAVNKYVRWACERRKCVDRQLWPITRCPRAFLAGLSEKTKRRLQLNVTRNNKDGLNQLQVTNDVYCFLLGSCASECTESARWWGG